PYKFYGPHLGLAFARGELLESWRPYKVRPAADQPLGHRYETGTLPHELLAGFVAAVDYLRSLGWDAIVAHERGLGERFLRGLPPRRRLAGRRRRGGGVSTFGLTIGGVAPHEPPPRLSGRALAVGHGNSSPGEVMRRLGLEVWGGAARVGIAHYNTADEVDR